MPKYDRPIRTQFLDTVLNGRELRSMYTQQWPLPISTMHTAQIVLLYCLKLSVYHASPLVPLPYVRFFLVRIYPSALLSKSVFFSCAYIHLRFFPVRFFPVRFFPVCFFPVTLCIFMHPRSPGRHIGIDC